MYQGGLVDTRENRGVCLKVDLGAGLDSSQSFDRDIFLVAKSKSNKIQHYEGVEGKKS